jgi:hypothetical protein
MPQYPAHYYNEFVALAQALINFGDVVTSRPLLSGGDAGTVQSMDYWGNLVFMKQD